MHNEAHELDEAQDNVRELIHAMRIRIEQGKAVLTLLNGGIIEPKEATHMVDTIGRRTN